MKRPHNVRIRRARAAQWLFACQIVVSCFFAQFLGISFAHAQTPPPAQTLAPWQIQNPLPQSHPLKTRYYATVGMNSVWFVNARAGWAVGRNGNIVATTDGGQTWTPQTSPVYRELQDVRFVSDNVGFATGFDGVIATQDGGKTWSVQLDSLFGNSLFFLNERTGWVVGSSGRVFATSDGGRTWARQALSSPNSLYDVFFTDERTGWITGIDGVYGTTDGGRTWTKRLALKDPTLGDRTPSRLWFTSPTRGWFTASDSTLFSTSDGGRTWSAQTLPVTDFTYRDLDLIHFISPTTGWVTADNGAVFRTTDGGSTWQRLFTFPMLPPNQLRFVDAQNGWATSGNDEFGVIWHTSDGGATWTQQRMSSLYPLSGVMALSTQRAVASGLVSPIVTNNGATWSLARGGTITASTFRGIGASDARTVWAVGNLGRMFRSNDAAATWSQVTGFFTVFDDFYAVAFGSPQVGVAVGGRDLGRGQFSPTLYRTGDGGATWARQTLPSGVTGVLNGAFFISQTNGWVVGTSGTILVTSDGGTTWTRQQSGTNRDLQSVFFVDGNTGWAVGGGAESGVIVRTGDGGATWTRQSAPTDNQLRSVFFANATNGWAVGARGTILGTTNGGENWRVQSSGVQADLNGVAFGNGVRGWVVGDSGIALRATNAGYTPVFAHGASNVLGFSVIPAGQSATQTLAFQAQYLLEPLTVSVPAGFELDFGSQRGVRSLVLQPDDNAATSGTITVRFVPTRDGIFAGAMTFSSALLSFSPASARSIALAGVGLNRATIAITPSAIAFPIVKIGSTTTASIWLKNTGTTAGTINLAFAGQQRDFVITASQPVQNRQLRPGDSVQAIITFAPQSYGRISESALLRVSGNFSDSTVQIRLTGTGGQALLAWQPRLLNLESVPINGSTSAIIGLVNRGNLPARFLAQPFLVSALTGGASGFSVSGRTGDQLLDSSETNFVQITFKPRQIGFARDTLVVVTDADTTVALVAANAEPLLATPTLETPPNERINIPVAPQFQWSNISEARSYDVQVARDTTLFNTQPEIDERNYRQRGIVPNNNLAFGTTYWWRVRAHNDRTESPWATPFRFKTIRTNALVRVTVDTAFTGIVGQSERLAFTLASSTSASLTLGRPVFTRNDGAAFSIREDQFPQSLRSRGATTVLFNFTPKDEVRYQALLFIPALNARGDTVDRAEIQLFGTGVARDSGLIMTEIAVRTSRNNVAPGDSLKVQLVMVSSQNLKLRRNQNRAATFDATLRIRNISTIAIVGDRPISPAFTTSDNLLFSGNTITLQNIPRDTNQTTGVLAELAAVALQGNDSVTPIEFVSFEWKDLASGQAQTTIRNVVDSTFTVAVCKAGGPRYIGIAPRTQLQALQPNPAAETALLTYSVGEKTMGELFVLDVLGRRVKTLVSGAIAMGEYELPITVGDLPEGVYTVVLRLPTTVVQQQLRVVK